MSAPTIVEVEGRKLSLTNLEKVLYPAAGFTKGQVVDYYVRIAPVLVPHLAGRPLTMKRFPEGVNTEYFFEKNAPKHRPDWVKTAPVWSESNHRTIHFILTNDLPTLVWIANLASIELHPSLSLAADIATPTMIVFDLDPGPPANIVQCCQVGLGARCLRALRPAEFCEDIGLQRNAGIRTAEYEDELRRNQIIRPRDRAPAGARASRTGRFLHEEGGPHQQNFCGLEPERSA